MNWLKHFTGEEHKRMLEENIELYKNLETQYLKLRREHQALQTEFEKFDEDAVDGIILDNKKLRRELQEARDLLTQYHLNFGKEIQEMMQKKADRTRKKRGGSDKEYELRNNEITENQI